MAELWAHMGATLPSPSSQWGRDLGRDTMGSTEGAAAPDRARRGSWVDDERHLCPQSRKIGLWGPGRPWPTSHQRGAGGSGWQHTHTGVGASGPPRGEARGFGESGAGPGPERLRVLAWFPLPAFSTLWTGLQGEPCTPQWSNEREMAIIQY